MKSLIPRQIIFSDPEKLMVKLSPNGEMIGFLAPFEDNLNLWVAPLNNIKEARAVTFSKHPLKDYQWAHDNDHLIFIHDENGDENWQLKSYRLSTQKTTTHTPKGCQVKIFHKSDKKPQEILVGINERDKRYHDVYSLNLDSLEKKLIYQNDQYWEFLADDDFNLHVAIKVVEKKGEYYDITQKEHRLITTVTLHDLFSYYFYQQIRPFLSHDGKYLYLAQSMESDTSKLTQIELKNGIKEDLGQDRKADVFDILYDKATKKPVAFATFYERKKWQALTPEMKEHFEILKNLDDGDIDILSQTADNQHWTLSFIHDDGPTKFYYYDCVKRKAQFLFDSHSAFPQYSFVKMQPKVITTRDGTECVSYLSLPENQILPAPLVLLVHGGPNFRDFWGFNPTHQWLANRGYAVLSVNYRASTGFGKIHFAKGHGQWAGKIQEDLLDAVDWAIKEKITTKDKVALMGRSFGGYATLVGLTMTPDVFTCGVDIVGPANLETMVKHFPPYWKAMKGAIDDMVGCNPDTPEGKAYLRERSPLHYAKNIKKPLIIGHGANDVRVMQSESDALVSAMQENGIPVTYAIFPDEGHQFTHPGNRMAFYALVEAFLAKSLEGEVEPFDKNVQTSMVVKVDGFGLI